MRLDHRIGWFPATGERGPATPNKGHPPRADNLSDEDLVAAAEELINKGLSQLQALEFLANYVLVDQRAAQVAREEGLNPSAAWDRAQDLLSETPEDSRETCIRILNRLRRRYPDAKNRVSRCINK